MSSTHLVALDGSAPSTAALAYTRALARISGAEVAVAYVRPVPVLVPAPYGAATMPTMDLETERVSVRPPAGCSTRPAGEGILAACADVDLLVSGSRGYGPLRGGMLIDHAPCPVLVIPRGAAVVMPAADLRKLRSPLVA